MQALEAERDLVENAEELLIRQMDVDTSKAIVEQKQEEKRQKIRDERKLVDEIYNQYLINKHPNYPLAKEKITQEEGKIGEEIKPKQALTGGDI